MSVTNLVKNLQNCIKNKSHFGKNFAIIGAGVSGLISAYFLHLCGASLTIYESGEGVCHGGSAGFQNGGQLSFGHVDSIASIQNLRSIFSLSCYIKVNFNLLFKRQFVKYALQYVKNCLPQKRKQNLQELANLANLSKRVFYDIFLQNFGDDNLSGCHYNTGGTIHYFYNQKYFLQKIKHYTSLGLNFKILTAQQAVEMENALCNVSGLCGGIYFEEDNSINCKLMCEKIYQILQNSGQVKFIFNHSFLHNKDYKIENGKIIALTQQKNFDCFIFTNGSGVNNLLSQVHNAALPQIYSMKGYSFDVDVSYSSYAPQIALTDSKRRIVYSVQNRYNASQNNDYNTFTNLSFLRVAGFADFTHNPSPRQIDKRIKYLYKSFLQSFRSLKQSTASNFWCGERPSTPTSVPLIIGEEQINISNCIIASGHTNLGLTLSFATACKIVGFLSLSDL